MTPIRVVAGLLFHESRLLVAQRPAGSHLAGLWEFPGGKLEADETWEAALVRELDEELGVRVAVGPLVDEVTHSYPGKAIQLRFYRCRLLSGVPEPRGCADLAWVGPAELGSLAFPEADTVLIRRLQQEPGLWVTEPEE